MTCLHGKTRSLFGRGNGCVCARSENARAYSTIYGSSTVLPKPFKVKYAWDDIAASVSVFSGITRSSAQCRKWYHDMRRRRKKTLAAVCDPHKVSYIGTTHTHTESMQTHSSIPEFTSVLFKIFLIFITFRKLMPQNMNNKSTIFEQ